MTDDPARDLAARLVGGEPSPVDLAIAAQSIKALGVPPAVVRNIRDDALREYLVLAHPGLKEIRAQARAVHLDLRRYTAGDWIRRHQHEIKPPPDIVGSPRALLWQALKHGALRTGSFGAEVLSEGQLRRIFK